MASRSAVGRCVVVDQVRCRLPTRLGSERGPTFDPEQEPEQPEQDGCDGCASRFLHIAVVCPMIPRNRALANRHESHHDPGTRADGSRRFEVTVRQPWLLLAVEGFNVTVGRVSEDRFVR